MKRRATSGCVRGVRWRRLLVRRLRRCRQQWQDCRRLRHVRREQQLSRLPGEAAESCVYVPLVRLWSNLCVFVKVEGGGVICLLGEGVMCGCMSQGVAHGEHRLDACGRCLLPALVCRSGQYSGQVCTSDADCPPEEALGEGAGGGGDGAGASGGAGAAGQVLEGCGPSRLRYVKWVLYAPHKRALHH